MGGTLYGGVNGRFETKNAAGVVTSIFYSGATTGLVLVQSADGSKYYSFLSGDFYDNTMTYFGADWVIGAYGAGAANDIVAKFTLAGQFLLGVGVAAGGTSLLKVDGQLESLDGGFKFPDGSVQITASSALGGTGTITVPTGRGRLEWTETIAAVGVTASSRVTLSLGATTSLDENEADTLDINSLQGIGDVDTIVVTATFGGPVSGPIQLNWSVI
jgi:hypothetical protein